MARFVVLVALLMACFSNWAEAVDYSREIKPLLQQKCYACHGAFQQKAKLRLDTAKFIKQGGESGAAIVDGKPDESLLLKALSGTAGFRMPPEGEGVPLTAQELGKVKEWIAAGAPVPEGERQQVDPKHFWSYLAPQAKPLPVVKNADWVKSPIDHFIAAEHEQRGLKPSPEATKGAWLRRVYLDLIGLPPTRAQLQTFLADSDSRAAERVVDDLLSRPQYGERWGRHWLDIWRYSDWYGSRGINEIRYSQRHIWRWRDWTVDSLNADKGYDRMVVEMLAADELAPEDATLLPATGFLGRNWYKFDRNVWMFETTERTAEAFLGLTLRCARCHDHKFDPILQTDYYQFRAIFEPHQVRTDPISALIGTEKDATLGLVLKDGIPRVFDKELDVPTYRFIRGDDRTPDKSQVMKAGVPASLGGAPFQVEPIRLPLGGYYPVMRAGVRETLLAKADADIETARTADRQAEQKIATARTLLNDFEKRANANPNPNDAGKGVFLHDNFETARPDDWQILDGNWVYEGGHLVEKAVTSFATIVTKKSHPESFKAKLKYRTLVPGTYRSIGFSFDFQDKGNSQDVYTSSGDAAQSVQAFHRVGGNQNYPAVGIKSTTLKVGDITTLEFIVKGSKLLISLNGKQELDYVMPVPRKPGKFAMWVHAGSAEFLECEITELTPSREQLASDVRTAEHNQRVARLRADIAVAEKASLTARIAAEQAKYSAAAPNMVQELALAASRAERTVNALQAQLKVFDAEFHLSKFEASIPATDQVAIPKPDAGKAEAEKNLAAARAEFDKASQAVNAAGASYQPIGDLFPTTSTGRRLALARWIASPTNPRTARVAVNHLWNRHFGQPLVATTENFGINGAQPTHLDLLDWLANELIKNNWQMKPLHRLIVLSATYRQASGDPMVSSESPATTSGLTVDPNNLLLWRMNSRRMEAEAVRDSVLALAGTLDLTRGGPEIPESQGQTSLRRSLYFRNTPNEKMPFLEVFDVADPNSCYRRKESVIPQQALAVMNSSLAQDHARLIATKLSFELGTTDDQAARERFIVAAFEHVLTREPTRMEVERCLRFLTEHSQLLTTGPKTTYSGSSGTKIAPASTPTARARESLIQVLLLHNDFVTIR